MEDLKQFIYSRTIVTPNGCWEWQGSRSVQGYGRISSPKRFGKEYLVHRISYLLNSTFTLPPNLCVLHKCDNPPCINPEHLFIGTRDINNKDRAAKGRTVTPNMNLTHCKRGHEFTKENTYFRKEGTTRLCRACVLINTSERYLRYRKPLTPKNKHTHCAKGHEFTKENTSITNKGTRRCKTCRNISMGNFYKRRGLK